MAVEIGDEAPDFELPDQHGTPVKLSSFRGAKNVVLVFYPLAFSPVCSGELCALREDFPEVSSDDVELITVSVMKPSCLLKVVGLGFADLVPETREYGH